MEIFNDFEIKQVVTAVPEVFEDDPSEATEVCLSNLAEGLLEALKSTRSPHVKKSIIKGFTTYAICSGMLINNRRVLHEGMLLQDNTTGLPH
jgi:hypothetical protein